MTYSLKPVDDNWHPDLEFITFLATIEQNSIMFGGDVLLREHMRVGSELGRTLYLNSYKNPRFQERYHQYLAQKLKDRPPT